MPPSAQEYLDLEIRILQRVDQGYPVEMTLGGQQEFPRGYLSADVIPWAASGDLAADGQQLFDKLLADPVLRGAWSEARGQSPQRRIRLRIDPTASELHVLPWELLHEGQVMLSAQVNTPFSRYLPIALRWGGAVQARPIRVLVVISNPDDLESKYDLPQMDMMLEEEVLEATFSTVSRQDLQANYLDAPASPERVEEALRKGYHLLHFLGHGAYSARRGQAALYMQDEAGHARRVMDDEFAALLARQGVQPHLVFLAACQSATRSTADAFRGLGPKLVSAGVPAVIAMQDNVTVKSARQFSATFYRRLLEHGQVDLAVNEARSTLLTCGRPDAAVPVLFMRIKSGKLWESEGAQEAIPARPALPPPPEPATLPEVTSFVGREAELAYYSGKLATLRLAVITGMPGVGKTTLASVLARRAGSDEKIFWHSFHENDGVEDAIWKLAGFLYWRGHKDLWEMLQGVQTSGGQLPPTRNLMDYAVQTLRGKGYLLCLDDLDHLSQEGLSLIGPLVQRLTGQQTSFVTTSQSVPDFVHMDDFDPLTGLSLEDTLTLLEQHGLPVDRTQDLKSQVYETQVLSRMGQQSLLSAEIVANLHARTGGNALFLTLAVDALKRTHAAARATFVVRLFLEQDIERFLMKDIDKTLTPEERSVMSAVAVLMGAPGTRDAIEAVLDGQNVRRTLTDLSERHLVNVSDGDAGREYSLNAIVRYFYYDSPSKSERQAMHRRAGAYYGTEEPNVLKAARHWLRAGEHSRAAGLVTERVGLFINRGEARSLRSVLESLTAQQVEAEQWAHVNLALGQAQAYLGETQIAQERYQAALQSVATLTESPETRDLKAAICRWFAELHYQCGEYPLALERVQAGLAALEGRETAEAAELTLVAAHVHIRRGDYESAQTKAQESLRLGFKLSHGTVLARAHNVLGRIEYHHGNYAPAIEQHARALAFYVQASDLIGAAKTHNLISMASVNSGQWSRAEQHARQAHELFQRLGDTLQCAILCNNLGFMARSQGRLDEAMAHCQASLELFQQTSPSLYVQSAAHATLGDILIRRGDIEAARRHLQTSLDYCEQIQARDFLPELYRLQAEAALALRPGDLTEATLRSQQSLSLARELGMRSDEGRTLRVVGEIATAQGQLDQAEAHLRDSLAILKQLGDEYEWARSQLALARLRVAQGDHRAGLAALDECEPVLARLGAALDLAQACDLREETARHI